MSDSTESRSLLRQDLLMKIHPENFAFWSERGVQTSGTAKRGSAREVPEESGYVLPSGLLPCPPPGEAPGSSSSSCLK